MNDVNSAKSIYTIREYVKAREVMESDTTNYEESYRLDTTKLNSWTQEKEDKYKAKMVNK